MFFKVIVLKKFASFAGKHQYRSLFLIKLQKEALTQVISCEICEVLRKLFLQNASSGFFRQFQFSSLQLY